MVFLVCQFCNPQPWSWSLGWSLPVPVHSIPTSQGSIAGEQRPLAGCHCWLGLRQTWFGSSLQGPWLGTWPVLNTKVHCEKCSTRWVIRYSSHFPPSGKVARPSPGLLTLEIQGELGGSQAETLYFPTVWKGRTLLCSAGTWSRQRKQGDFFLC